MAPAAKDVDAAKIEALITAATSARATGFVDSTAKTGLDKPELTIAVQVRPEQGRARDLCASRRVGLCGARRQSRAPRRSTPPPSTASSKRSRTSNSARHACAARGSQASQTPRRAAASAALVGGAARLRRRARPAVLHDLPAQASRAVRELRADLARVFGAPIMDRGVWGVDVRSLDTGERLYSLNAGKLMMPASNMKILTLAAGAEVLGWDYRFTTTLETAGTIADGVLRGDLIVRSNGDPSINAREGRADAVLDEWARALAGRRHLLDRGAHHRRRPGVRRRRDWGGVGVGLPAIRVRGAGRRARVQREHGHAHHRARSGSGRSRHSCA